MAYNFETDGLKHEVVVDFTGTQYLRFWPKVAGVGAVAGAAAAAYSLRDPGGQELASGFVNPTALADGTGRYDIPVPAGLFAVLEEHCSCLLDWSDGTDTFRKIIPFDVVKYPFSAESFVALSELQQVRTDIFRHLERHAVRVGIADPDKEEQAASIFGYQARVKLDSWIRSATISQGLSRPTLVLSRDRLQRVEVPLTIALIYEAVASDPLEGAGDASANARYYLKKAEDEWASLGPLVLDVDGDGIADTEERLGGTIRTTPRQAK